MNFALVFCIEIGSYLVHSNLQLFIEICNERGALNINFLFTVFPPIFA
ncbi:hypothetical protein SAMN05421824_1197 [Hyunsoonleella jejuensis]|uniref:Uncharacterized protein n=1 Tax=Hyunsoonleella jejuensis TaxID=419940 RepID=A0A1H9DCM8_9FLAO|nr:hypothetical protein SAMN05421824_1197 [Hyunsoonleella jejuensis]